MLSRRSRRSARWCRSTWPDRRPPGCAPRPRGAAAITGNSQPDDAGHEDGEFRHVRRHPDRGPAEGRGQHGRYQLAGREEISEPGGEGGRLRPADAPGAPVVHYISKASYRATRRWSPPPSRSRPPRTAGLTARQRWPPVRRSSAHGPFRRRPAHGAADPGCGPGSGRYCRPASGARPTACGNSAPANPSAA